MIISTGKKLSDYLMRMSSYSVFRSNRKVPLSDPEEFGKVANFVASQKLCFSNKFPTFVGGKEWGYKNCTPASCKISEQIVSCNKVSICPHCWAKKVVHGTFADLVQAVQTRRASVVTFSVLRRSSDPKLILDWAASAPKLVDHFFENEGRICARKVFPSSLFRKEHTTVVLTFFLVASGLSGEYLVKNFSRIASFVFSRIVDPGYAPYSSLCDNKASFRKKFFVRYLAQPLFYPRSIISVNSRMDFFESWEKFRFPRTTDRTGCFR